MSRNLLSILEYPQNERLLSSFFRVKIPNGLSLGKAYTAEPAVAILVSGHVRAYLSVDGNELTIFHATERGELVQLGSDLILRARRHSELLLMPRDAFLKLMATDPEFFWTAYPWLEARFSQTLRIIFDIRFLDVRTRVIRFLLDLCAERGTKVLDGISIPVDLTIEDIADILGSSRQSISQVLNDLIRARHLRRVSRNQFIVLDADRLTAELSAVNPRVKSSGVAAGKGGRLTVGRTVLNQQSAAFGNLPVGEGKATRPRR